MNNTRTQLKDYATQYTINLLVLKWQGKGWGIYRKDGFNYCYDKILGKFVYEPMPSSRTELFFEACRFGLVEAIAILKKLDPTMRI